MEEKNYRVKMKATFTYQADGEIDGNYFFSNGHPMGYTMKNTNNHKTSDAAFGTASETGSYRYDDKISVTKF